MASLPKSKGPQALYPRCETHIQNAGLSFTEASGLSKISASSIHRIRKQEPVLVTTIVKLINALNEHHYNKNNRPLSVETEMQRL